MSRLLTTLLFATLLVWGHAAKTKGKVPNLPLRKYSSSIHNLLTRFERFTYVYKINSNIYFTVIIVIMFIPQKDYNFTWIISALQLLKCNHYHIEQIALIRYGNGSTVYFLLLIFFFFSIC